MWACQWLLGTFGDDPSRRPDRLGVLFDLNRDGYLEVLGPVDRIVQPDIYHLVRRYCRKYQVQGVVFLPDGAPHECEPMMSFRISQDQETGVPFYYQEMSDGLPFYYG
jgi:hypothetical protein